LLCLGALIDSESTLGVTNALEVLAKDQADERILLSPESEAVLEVLGTSFQEADVTEFRPMDLCADVERLINSKISPQAVGSALRRLGVNRDTRGRRTSGSGSIYRISRAELQKIKEAWYPQETPQDCDEQNIATNQPVETK